MLPPLLLLAFALLLSCTPDTPQSEDAQPAASSPQSAPSEPVPNRPPVIRSAVIVPTPIHLNETVFVKVDGDDPDGDGVAYRFQWFANGLPLEGRTSSSTVLTGLKRGDEVMVEIVPSDGRTEGAVYRTEKVEIGNTPPEVMRVALEPPFFRAGEWLKVEVEVVDADKDVVQVTFKWWRNGVPIGEGESRKLATNGFIRDDHIVVQAIPFDAGGPGKAKYSEPATVANGAPAITSTPPVALKNGRYEYTVTAVDPEGDPLTYRLDAGPPGMTLDKVTGVLRWQVTPETKGMQRVRISVLDDHQGYAFQEFDLSLPQS